MEKKLKNGEAPKRHKLILQIIGGTDITDFKTFLLKRIDFQIDIKIEEVAKTPKYTDVLVDFPSKSSSRKVTDVLHESNHKHRSKIWCYYYIADERKKKQKNTRDKVNSKEINDIRVKTGVDEKEKDSMPKNKKKTAVSSTKLTEITKKKSDKQTDNETIGGSSDHEDPVMKPKNIPTEFTTIPTKSRKVNIESGASSTRRDKKSRDDFVKIEPTCRDVEEHVVVEMANPNLAVKQEGAIKKSLSTSQNQCIAQIMILEIHVTNCSSEDECKKLLERNFGSSIIFDLVDFVVESNYSKIILELPSQTVYRKAVKKLYCGDHRKRFKIVNSYPKGVTTKTCNGVKGNRVNTSKMTTSDTSKCGIKETCLVLNDCETTSVAKDTIEEKEVMIFEDQQPLTLTSVDKQSRRDSSESTLKNDLSKTSQKSVAATKGNVGHESYHSSLIESKMFQNQLVGASSIAKHACKISKSETIIIDDTNNTSKSGNEKKLETKLDVPGKIQLSTTQEDKASKKKRAKAAINALNTKFKPQSIEIEIQNFKKEEKPVEVLLQRRLKDKEPFTIKLTETIHDTAFVTVEFMSTNSSKRAMDLLLKSNNKFNAQIRCYIDKDRRMIAQKLLRNKRLSNLASQLADKAGVLIDKHNAQLGGIKARVETISGNKEKRKFQSLDMFEIKKREKEALVSKQDELENQMKEFKSFIKVFHDRLESIKDTTFDDDELLELETTFKIECERFSTSLPIYARRADIINKTNDNQTTIILGETGSGKSTQIVQYLYQTGTYSHGTIVCTQPRKVAAISLATHVAKELSSNVGNIVGYQVGMQSKKSTKTKIMYMTDHILLNECLRDPSLKQFSCIIIDEAHERSIYTDLLLGMIKNCLPSRNDLKVIITSATITPDVFVRYFDNQTPVLKVSGRLFPVDIEWCNDNCDDNYETKTLRKTIEVHNSEPDGDILVFLTSPLEVEKCCKNFEEKLRKNNDFICLPLHGKLHANEQQRVFCQTPRGKRKVIFATNSAETSITIPGIKYVVDSGRIKEMQFDTKKNISSLVVTLVTQSSANQRSGRAGRTAPGKCFRLYSEKEFSGMKACSTPEILRVNLGQALINLLELNVDPLSFDFVESPPKDQISTAMETLESIGATSDGKLTELGKWIAKLPFDPIFGVFIHDAIQQDIGIEALVLTACCGSGGSLFYRSGSTEQKSNSDKMKIRFSHEGGDVLTMLNAFREWHMQPEQKKGKWCADNYVNGKTIKAVRDTVTEAIGILRKDLQIKVEFKFSDPLKVDAVLQKMLFKMFKHNICHFLGHQKAGYHVLNKAINVSLFPSSALPALGIHPEWIVIEQVLHINRDFAVNATPIPKEWIDEGLEEGWLRPLILDRAEELKVKCLNFHGVGEYTFREFVGPRYCRLKQIELELSEMIKSSVIIDTDCVKGEISLFSSAENDSISVLQNHIDSILASIKKSHKQEKSEQFLSSAKRGTRVVVSSGCNIDDILMPDEYKTVLVACDNQFHTDSITVEDVENIFLNYGNIEKIEKFHSLKSQKNWGRVTFLLTEEAMDAVQETKEEFIHALPTGNVRLQNEYRFKAKFEWCRRKSKGSAFVEFSDPRIPNNILEDYSELNIVGKQAVIELSRTDASQIRVLKLDRFVNEAVLRHAFVTKFNLSDDHIVRATVCRERVTTSKEDFRTIFRRLRGMIEQHVKKGRFELYVKPPNDKDFTFIALASFSQTDEGQNACMYIEENFKPNDEIVTASTTLHAPLLVVRQVYEHCKEDILDSITSLNEEVGIDIRYRELRNGNCAIDISCDHIDSLYEVRRELDAIVQGKKMNKEDFQNIGELFTRAGKYEMRKLMTNTKTLIIDDYRTLDISIYGEHERQEEAFNYLKEYLQKLSTGVCRSLFLRGPDKPFGIIKELFVRFSIDLCKLRIKIKGLNCVQIDLRNHSVSLNGTNEAVEKAIAEVNDVIEHLRNIQGHERLEDESHQCAICFMEIEEGDMYRLEVCGHPFCNSCIIPQFESAIGNIDFPLVCCREDCSEPWSWRDQMTISLKSGIAINDLVNRATSWYIARHGKKYKYCTSPDCPSIYRVTEKSDEFRCNECGVRICTACNTQYHDGFTCEEMKEIREDSSGIKIWLSKDPKNRKLCPECGLPIEKTGGCNKMECSKCKRHICWLCLKHYSSMRECYAHLGRVHGGYGGGY